MTQWSVCCVAAVFIGVSAAGPALPAKLPKGASNAPAALWTDPADIASRDLIYGPGGPGHQPRGPFKYVKEDLNGTNPKFVITDADNVKWKVKLGLESRPETAASRLVWAAGYFADEEYFLPDLKVDNIPSELRRGEKYVEPNGIAHNVRLKRYLKDEEKSGSWQWRSNPFTGTREFSGLRRVMMALINNWDLKDENNKVYSYEGNDGSIWCLIWGQVSGLPDSA